MSISNINTLQNPIDLSELSNYTSDYLIQSLANAGQKVGVKGDGIKFNKFTFLDILTNIKDKNSIDKDKYIGYIKYNNETAEFGLTKKGYKINDSNIPASPYSPERDTNTFNTVNIETFIELDYKINNIDKYVSYGNKLTYSDNKLRTFLFGKLLNKEENIPNNIEISYNEFNEESGIINTAIRVFHLYNNGVSNMYGMFVLSKTGDVVDYGGYQEIDYELEFYKFDTSLLQSKQLKNYFEELFNYSFYSQDINIIKQNPLFNSIYSIDNLFDYVDESDCTLYGLIKNHELNNEINYINNPIKLTYDSSKNQHFYIKEKNENNNYKEINTLLNGNVDIDTRLYFFNNDLIYNYPNFVKLYSYELFTSSALKIYRKIIFGIYEYLHKNLSDKKVLYIPLDYNFNYIYNSNEPLEIYKGENIFITNVNIDSKNKNDAGEYYIFTENKNLIFDNGEDVNEYNENVTFNVIYHKEFNDKINKIEIERLYVLPYININNNWVINNSDSNISAIGKNAGNPNIIILFNNIEFKEDKGVVFENKIICSAYSLNKNLTSYIKYRTENIYIPGSKFSVGDMKLNCKVQIPEINISNKSILENSLIILISDTNCITNNINNNIDEGTKDIINRYKYITTIWYIEQDNIYNGYPQFSCLMENELTDESDTYPLDFTSLLNVNEIIDSISKNYSNYSSPSFETVYLSIPHAENKLDENTLNSKIKNSISIESVEYYKKLLLNLPKIDNEGYKEVSSNYYNNLSFINKLNYSIKSNTEDINYFINDIVNLKSNDITNILYPKIGYFEIITQEEDNVNTVIDEYGIQSKKINVQYDDIYADGNYEFGQSVLTTDNIDELVKIKTTITNTNTNTKKETKYGIKYGDDSGIEYHEEYVFNKNVPTLDLQEVFVANNNTLNRLNIISIENINGSDNAKLYNAYIGTSFTENNKSYFHIGTTNKNINIGNNILLSYTQTDKFYSHDGLSIDFDNIKLNSNLTETKIIKTEKSYTKHNLKEFNITNYSVKDITYYEFEYGKLSYAGFMNELRYYDKDGLETKRDGLIKINPVYTKDGIDLIKSEDYDEVDKKNIIFNNELGASCTLPYSNDPVLNIKIRDNNNKYECVNYNYLKDREIFIFENFKLTSDDPKLSSNNSNIPFVQRIEKNGQCITSFMCLNNIINNYFKVIYEELENTGINNIKLSQIDIKYFLNGKCISTTNETSINSDKGDDDKYLSGNYIQSDSFIILPLKEIDKKYDIISFDEWETKKELLNIIDDNKTLKYYLFPLPVLREYIKEINNNNTKDYVKVKNNSFTNYEFESNDNIYGDINDIIDNEYINNYIESIECNNIIENDLLLKLKNKLKFITYKINTKYYLEVYYTDENVFEEDFHICKSKISCKNMNLI